MESASTFQQKLAAMKSELSSEVSFLTGDHWIEKILLTSYPRSGNTLSRSYLETISRIYTGSDCDTRRPLNRHLLEMGLVGEGTVDNKVWIVKSHFPERLG